MLSMYKIWDFEAFNNRIAFMDDEGRSLDYRELADKGNSLARAVGSRCLVFVLCSNSIGSVLGYSAFVNNGIVPLLISSGLDQDLLNNLIELYAPEYLWLPDDKKESYPEMETVFEAFGYSLMDTKKDMGYPINDDLALLLTTSGSTGSPKFVRQSYRNIQANTESIVEYLELNETERAITTLPMNYTYGLSIINTHLYVGATVLLTDKGLMQKEFWNFFKESKATSFGGVPYTYEMLDRLRFYRMDLPELRTMTQAGGKLSPELHEKFARYADEEGKKFVVMYGQCEATARMGYLPADMAVSKKGSMGIPIPGGDFRLIDIDGNEIKTPYTTGELVYEGDNVTLGYAESRADLNKGDERHGRLVTGDMAQFDEDGYYFIVGRKKRFLKIYGNRVNLDEMDRLIKTEFGIEAACGGVDDHLYIFITDPELSGKVREYASDITKLNPAAFSVVILDEIPKNDAGKTLYKKLEQYYK